MTLPGSYGEATPHHCSIQAKRGTHARRTATTSSSTGLPRRTTQGKACSWRTPSGWTPGSSTCGTPNPSTSTSALITLRRTACTDGNPDGGNSCSIFLSLGCAKQAGPRGSVTHLALRDSAGSGEAGSAALRALKGPQLHLPHLYLLSVTCLPVQQAPAPPPCLSPTPGSLEPGLSSAFSDLLEPLGARKMKRAAAEQGPQRQPFPLELTLLAYTPPSAGAYIQYKLPAAQRPALEAAS